MIEHVPTKSFASVFYDKSLGDSSERGEYHELGLSYYLVIDN